MKVVAVGSKVPLESELEAKRLQFDVRLFPLFDFIIRMHTESENNYAISAPFIAFKLC